MTEGALRTLTVVDSVVIQCSLALLLGALASGFWLRRATSPWARSVGRLSRRWLVVGALLALAAELASLWLQAAEMVDGPGTTAGPMMRMVLRDTHFGHAWWFGVVALVAVLVAASMSSGASAAITALAVAVFAASRSVVSHAGGQGDFTLKVGVDWIHLLFVCTWVGIVALGAFVALRRAPLDRAEGADAASWVTALSRTATTALVSIVLTGAVKVCWAIPSWGMLVGSTYATVLLVKLGLAGIAALLGAYNRFRSMPDLLRNLTNPDASNPSLPGGFVVVMRLEAGVLLGVVIAAAVLSGTATPGEN